MQRVHYDDDHRAFAELAGDFAAKEVAPHIADSGDLGYYDEFGLLHVVDRKKDMIKTGGENVASREVEEVLYRHPGVQEVAVFGIPHPVWVEAVVAAVVIRDGGTIDEDELIAHCRAHLAGYKTPKKVFFVDSLPKNPSGKLLKRDLRTRFGSKKPFHSADASAP
jgi:fatty-acyl-CoA synthase